RIGDGGLSSPIAAAGGRDLRHADCEQCGDRHEDGTLKRHDTPLLNSPDEEADGSRRRPPTTLRTPDYGSCAEPSKCFGPTRSWRRPKFGSTITGGLGQGGESGNGAAGGWLRACRV